MNQDQPPYLSYLLRLWLEDDQEPGQAVCAQGEWRASLQDPHTQEMQIFNNLEALVAFLLEELQRRSAEKMTGTPASTSNI